LAKNARAPNSLDPRGTPIAVLNVGRMDDRVQQQTEPIDDAVFLPLTFLPTDPRRLGRRAWCYRSTKHHAALTCGRNFEVM